MSSKTVSVPKYRHHKGSGQAFVQVNGRRHYLGKWDSPKSKERYARFVAELAVSPAPVSVVPAATEGLTIVELAAAYIDFAEGYYRKNGKPTTHLPQLKAAIRLVHQLYGSTLAVDFGPLALRAIQQKMVVTGASRRYINQHAGHVKRMFRWAVSMELLPPAVHQGLATVPGLKAGRTAARETLPVLPVADEVVDATLPHLPLIVADMVRFERLTGARPGEVCQLRPCDVDRNGEVWQYRPESHKTQHHGLARIVYIGPQAQQVLLPYLLRDAEANCFQPVESEQKRHEEQRALRRTRVQPSQRNRRKARPVLQPRTAYTKDSYRRAVARAIEKANAERTKEAEDMGIAPMLLPHWHPNQLRHSAATEIRRQFGLEAAQVLLGHAKADTTQIYAERDSRLAVEVARKIG
ncbi:MAG: site-specific integrase [Planctomycetes bacterium]|nr:site-specific integrase [Planctomycetota bacterium]MBU4398523.1 site-specific integrase [Planctomycetota bacterium]MCG2684809.1 site-specific integrase [Planctomycetales bacterium]